MKLIIIFSIPLLVVLAVISGLIQDKLTRILFLEYPNHWISCGEPGGWFWRPEGRSFWDNLRITHQFWVLNQFQLNDEALFPESLLKNFKLYYMASLAILIMGVFGMLSLIALHAYSLGATKE